MYMYIEDISPMFGSRYPPKIVKSEQILKDNIVIKPKKRNEIRMSLSEVQGSEKNLIAQLVSRLSLSDNVVHGEPWATSRVFS